jgi:hypothetical protein
MSLSDQARERSRQQAVQQAQELHKKHLRERQAAARKRVAPTEEIKEDPNFGKDSEKVYVKALYDYPGQESGHLSFVTVSCFLRLLTNDREIILSVCAKILLDGGKDKRVRLWAPFLQTMCRYSFCNLGLA